MAKKTVSPKPATKPATKAPTRAPTKAAVKPERKVTSHDENDGACTQCGNVSNHLHIGV